MHPLNNITWHRTLLGEGEKVDDPLYAFKLSVLEMGKILDKLLKTPSLVVTMPPPQKKNAFAKRMWLVYRHSQRERDKLVMQKLERMGKTFV